FDSLVPTLVDDGDLVRANALDQFVRPAALQLAGPSLGGVLIATGGAGLAFAADAVTFAVSAACLLLMRAGAVVRDETDTSEISVWAEFKEGMNHVRGNVWLWGTFVAATF